jgi:hypothetical protein
MKLDHRAIVKLLAQDIKWHRENRGSSGCGESFENGMIVGLQQAQRLIRSAVKVEKLSDK